MAAPSSTTKATQRSTLPAPSPQYRPYNWLCTDNQRAERASPDGSAPSVLKPGCDWGNMEDMFRTGGRFHHTRPMGIALRPPTSTSATLSCPFRPRDTIQPIRGYEGLVGILKFGRQGCFVTLTKYLSGWYQVEFAKTASSFQSCRLS